LTLALAG